MDMKIAGAVLAIALLAFVGVGFATNWYHGIGNGHAANQNGTWQRGPWQGNGTGPGLAPRFNATAKFNSTELRQFQQAIASGDYQAAMQLHNEYGFGGPVFDKLNETTFGQYSQIYNLANELRQELGMNGTGAMPGFGGFMGMGDAPRQGPGMNGMPGGPGFGGFKGMGMRRRINQNSSAIANG